MRTRKLPYRLSAILPGLLTAVWAAGAPVVFETTTPYHHIRVIDQNGVRTLCFDDATQSQMSLQDPRKGHFEYTDYFHTAWLWNAKITNVLMVGLGGASTQRAMVDQHPGVRVTTVEIDPVVGQVARDYFNLRESDAQKVFFEDGRVWLRRSTAPQDLIILDAYISGRYGSAIPQHLATKEFFELARDHLGTNGILAYNVIGTMSGWHANVVGAMYRTMKLAFPQVYIFQARTSRNLVFIATRSPVKLDVAGLRTRADFLVRTRAVAVPGFAGLVDSLQYLPPSSAPSSPVLTDDFAPVEGLSGRGANPDVAPRPKTKP